MNQPDRAEQEQEWPETIDVSCGSNVFGQPVHSVIRPSPSPPRDDYDPETRTYVLFSYENVARLELIRDHDGNDLSDNDKALLTRLTGEES